MPTPHAYTKVADVAIWFKHIDNSDFRAQLESLRSEEEIVLEIDEVVGRWRRMRTGRDGRMVNGLRPVGPMKDVWVRWFEEDRGRTVAMRPVSTADDLAASASSLMVEWSTPEDEAAFAGL